ncbi:MAG: hypothetical protein ACT4OM_03010 [Actinomycetota bacterium]
MEESKAEEQAPDPNVDEPTPERSWRVTRITAEDHRLRKAPFQSSPALPGFSGKMASKECPRCGFTAFGFSAECSRCGVSLTG